MLTSLHSLNLSFPLLLYIISAAIVKFLPWFPASSPWFPTFLAFSSRFLAIPGWFLAPAFSSPSSSSRPYTPHFSHFVSQFTIFVLQTAYSVWNLLEFILRKKLLLFKNTHTTLLLLHNPRNPIIVYIIYGVISVITKCYLPFSASSKKSIICEVWANKSESLKYYLTFMTKRGSVCSKLSIFCNLWQFAKIYVTNFVPSQFWWITDCGVNDMKHIFIQIFLLSDPHVDYTIRGCGSVGYKLWF